MSFVLWLKPRGLNQLYESITPKAVRQYYQFVYKSVSDRIALQAEQTKMREGERRQDIFYFLCEARDPDTGLAVYDEIDLRSEANLLIIAGSDTTAISLCGIFFYLTSNAHRYEKLVTEIRSSFDSTDDIVPGPKLSSCAYLKACIDEGMRLTPSGPCELPREVLSGGLTIKGEYFPPKTIVGTAPWANSRNQKIYKDATVFRPERWIVDEDAGVTKVDVAQMRSNFHPFSSGPGNCVGQNLAMMEMMIVIARTLYRLDVRRVPGSTLGGGKMENRDQYQLVDAYISLRRGPEVQFRKRSLNS